MIKQFQSILQTPKHQQPATLSPIQSFILDQFQNILGISYDKNKLLTNIKHIEGLQEQSSCNFLKESTSSKGFKNLYRNEKVPQKQFTHHEQYLGELVQKVQEVQGICISSKLFEVLVGFIKQYMIPLTDYSALEAQTQRAQATIRSYIKLQHEMHVYMVELEKKLEQYKKFSNQQIKKNNRESVIIQQQSMKAPSNSCGTEQKIHTLQIEVASLKKQNCQLKQEIFNLQGELKKLWATIRARQSPTLCRRLLNFHEAHTLNSQLNKISPEWFPEIYQSNRSTKNSKNYQISKADQDLLDSQVQIHCTTEIGDLQDSSSSLKIDASLKIHSRNRFPHECI